MAILASIHCVGNQDDALYIGTRIENVDLHPVLSCYGIQILMATTMPERRSNADEVIRQLHERHRKPQAAIDSAAAHA